ncbi:hypothetical protein ABT120_31335 [Nonomuraea angiospora]|uniref:hypothetical protein n=1 Tax=Nonomuraea angiospora TaxID=46172 RepID=UPI00332C975B
MFLAPYFVLIGWLLGVMTGEIAFGRPRGPIRRAPGIRLVAPQLTATWLICAAFSCGVAFSTVERSLSAETTVGRRLGAAAALAVVAGVQFMVSGLHRRALLPGPADLVGGELATRSHAARWLLGVGASVALWTSVIALPIEQFNDIGVPALVGLPILALALASNAWRAGASGKRTTWLWVTAGVALAGVGLAMGRSAWQETPDAAAPEILAGPFQYALMDPGSGTWTLRREGQQQEVGQASTRLSGEPFVLSGDGLHLVYVDDATRRLVQQDLSGSGARHDLTGPLTGRPLPEVVLSQDGRYVSVGPEVIDNRTGARTRLPGVGRVLGFGPDGVMATTGHRAPAGSPDTELLTIGYDGTVRTRAPFDPTLEVIASPDARALVVLTEEEVLTMDPRTAEIRGHAKLSVPEQAGTPKALAWARDGRLLIKIDADAEKEFQLVDPGTGEASPVRDLPANLDGAVFGRIQ